MPNKEHLRYHYIFLSYRYTYGVCQRCRSAIIFQMTHGLGRSRNSCTCIRWNLEYIRSMSQLRYGHSENLLHGITIELPDSLSSHSSVYACGHGLEVNIILLIICHSKFPTHGWRQGQVGGGIYVYTIVNIQSKGVEQSCRKSRRGRGQGRVFRNRWRPYAFA